jgi:hypothetical protein
VVVIIAVVAGLIIAKNWEKIVGVSVTAGARAMFQGLQLPADEKQAAMVPVQELADKIKSKQVSVEQAGSVMKSVLEGPLPYVIILRAFEVAYLQPSSLPAEEKTAGHVTVTRFAKGLIDNTVDRNSGKEIMNVISVKTTGPGGKENVKFKETITVEELKKSLAIMKEAADKAGVEDKEFKVDIAAEIRKAIDASLSAKPAPKPEEK